MRIAGIRCAAAITGLFLATMPAPSASAGITGADVFGNAVYAQTSASGAPDLKGYFFSSRIFYSDPADVSSANGTSSGLPFDYGIQPGNIAGYATPFITQPELAGYLSPGGMFSAEITGGNLAGTTLAAGPYGPDLYSAVPILAASSYDALQGLDASKGTSLMFNGFTADPNASSAAAFVTIFRASDNAVVYSQDFLPPGTTSVSVAGGILDADTAYVLEIDYSNRLAMDLTVNGDTLADSFTTGYDVRTEVAFTTAAIPEPSGLILGGLAAAGLAGFARFRARTRS
ncbi:hypothetical protein [Aquisphaera insulae]|uniref:hypothetical protein n=1 Tax=Aquisphaera insulae TaxID=2712864 RepID=UPI0013EA61F3|nr:hypothetical protein [Aquisphaera insulae]